MNLKEIEDDIANLNIQHTNIRNQLVRIEGILIYLEQKKLLLLQQKKPKENTKTVKKTVKKITKNEK